MYFKPCGSYPWACELVSLLQLCASQTQRLLPILCDTTPAVWAGAKSRRRYSRREEEVLDDCENIMSDLQVAALAYGHPGRRSEAHTPYFEDSKIVLWAHTDQSGGKLATVGKLDLRF